MKPTITLDEHCIGKVISDQPYVKLLSIPQGQMPLVGPATMRAIAQVDDTICLIEVAVEQQRRTCDLDHNVLWEECFRKGFKSGTCSDCDADLSREQEPR